ncbi:MAG: ABC transporter permease [Actinophytocola sp.]|nr:ABC transporter permease [Actinophytocola sp.]
MAHDSLYAQPEAPAERAEAHAWWRTALTRWDTVIVVVLAAVVVVASLSIDGFASTGNAQFLLLDVVPIALIALPLTLIIITGEIDLSVASTLGLCSAVMGQLWLTGLPLEVIVVLVVLLGGLLGAVNGVFVTRFGLPALAVTIGTLAAYRGLAYVVLGDRAVADFPYDWTAASLSTVAGGSLPWAMVMVLLLACAFGVVLHVTPFGRKLYAMGNNAEAASFAGVSVATAKFWLFVTSGAVSGLAGVFWTLRFASARADNAFALELAVVAAVLLGGVSIFGGRGALLGVLAGVLLLGTVRNALQLADVSSEALYVVTGSLLVASVVVPNVVGMARSWLRRRRRAAPA